MIKKGNFVAMENYICKDCGNPIKMERKNDDGFEYIECSNCGNEIYFCEKCHEELITKIEGMCIGQYCPKCKEWVMVTSYIPPKK